MKVYGSPRQVLSQVEQVLSARPQAHGSPLEKAVEVLSGGRHYTWVGIYLAVSANFTQKLAGGGEPHPGQMARPETRSKVIVSIKLAGRELGLLDAESDRENAFGTEDRVLLENVAALVARFLTGPGKYLARKARESAAG
ncbi:MAG TPA: hypothetical protein VLV49_05755 [Terriglobales bacterium]|nr:hypothetical protein [Terriglobales bacterium]